MVISSWWLNHYCTNSVVWERQPTPHHLFKIFWESFRRVIFAQVYNFPTKAECNSYTVKLRKVLKCSDCKTNKRFAFIFAFWLDYFTEKNYRNCSIANSLLLKHLPTQYVLSPFLYILTSVWENCLLFILKSAGGINIYLWDANFLVWLPKYVILKALVIYHRIKYFSIWPSLISINTQINIKH